MTIGTDANVYAKEERNEGRKEGRKGGLYVAWFGKQSESILTLKEKPSIPHFRLVRYLKFKNTLFVVRSQNFTLPRVSVTAVYGIKFTGVWEVLLIKNSLCCGQCHTSVEITLMSGRVLCIYVCTHIPAEQKFQLSLEDSDICQRFSLIKLSLMVVVGDFHQRFLWY